MTRYTKTQVTQLSANEQAAINSINKNFDDIQTAIQDTVSRSGNTPTHMTNDLDMNGKRIINVPAPSLDTDLVRRKDVVGDITLVQNLVNATTNAAAQTLQAAADVQQIIQDRNVGLVADDLALDENSKIRICGTNIDDISNASDNMVDIKAVNNNKTNIDSVAGNITNINAVNTNKTNIDTCASNISAITDASTQATNAANSATAANNSAIAAAASAASIDPSTIVHKTGDESSVRGMVYTVVSALPADPDSNMIYLIPA